MKRVGFVRCIATSYVWRRRISVVAEEKEGAAVDPSGLKLGAAAERDRLVGLVFVVVTVRGVVEVCFVLVFGVILFGGGRGWIQVRGPTQARVGWSSASGLGRDRRRCECNAPLGL